MNDLAGKAVLITGASKGIGRAAALAFAEAGANVLAMARSEAPLKELCDEAEKFPGSCAYFAGDVANVEDMERAVSQCVSTFGSLDILINNAGLIDPISRLENSDPAAWANVMSVNVNGVYYGARFAIPQMKRQGGGTIINISSGAAHGALEGWSHYCASKAAVYSLTKCLHKEEGENGIRVCGLSPGTVATDMQVDIKASGINPVSQLDPSVHIPAEWVAKALLWLAGPGADDYLGDDFSLKTDEGRAKVGLPPI